MEAASSNRLSIGDFCNLCQLCRSEEVHRRCCHFSWSSLFLFWFYCFLWNFWWLRSLLGLFLNIWLRYRFFFWGLSHRCGRFFILFWNLRNFWSRFYFFFWNLMYWRGRFCFFFFNWSLRHRWCRLFIFFFYRLYFWFDLCLLGLLR